MNWNFFRRQVVDDHPIDIERVTEDGLRDRPASRAAIKLLVRERKALVRQRKVIHREYRDLTLNRLKIINRAATSPQMQELMLSQAVGQAVDPGEAAQRRDAELAALDERYEAVMNGLRRILQRNP